MIRNHQVCKMFNNGSEEGWEKYNGDIWDHIYAEFVYPNGARCMSMSGHGPGGRGNSEKILGTKGWSACKDQISGENSWKYEGKRGGNPQQLEHNDLMKSIRAGKVLNEGQRIAESTLTAIGARIAATTGRTIKWDWLLKSTSQDLVPPHKDLINRRDGIFNPIATGGDKLI